MGNVLHYLLFGELPALDVYNRPKWAYGLKIHDLCERRGHFDAGEFVHAFGDEGAKQGFCLYKVGCKGLILLITAQERDLTSTLLGLFKQGMVV